MPRHAGVNYARALTLVAILAPVAFGLSLAPRPTESSAKLAFPAAELVPAAARASSAPSPASALAVAPEPVHEQIVAPAPSAAPAAGGKPRSEEIVVTAEPTKAPVADELDSINLRFEVRNVDYTLLDDPVPDNFVRNESSFVLNRGAFRPVVGTHSGLEVAGLEGHQPMEIHEHSGTTRRELLEDVILETVRGLLRGAIHHEDDHHTDASSIIDGTSVSMARRQQKLPDLAGSKGKAKQQTNKTAAAAADGAPKTKPTAAIGSASGGEAATSPPLDSLPIMSVAFSPGRNRPGMTSTVVKVDMVDTPGTGADMIRQTEDVVRRLISDGKLQGALSSAIRKATRVEPMIGTIFEDVMKVEPYHVEACATHLDKLITRFSAAYTRERVPEALLHACDSFNARQSFSHDTLVDLHDGHRCRAATKQFLKLWQFGKGKVDYSRYCLQLCELTHGEDAIRCDAYKYIAIGP